MKKIITIFVLFISSFGLTGCAGPELFIAPIVNGIIMWKEGEAHKYYEYNSDIVYRAAKHALDDMNLDISRNDPITANREYYMIAGENDRFKINIIPHELSICRLSVRINFMGDKPYAELFYKKIDEWLSNIEFDQDGRPVHQ